jgi:ClpP class serine protease
LIRVIRLEGQITSSNDPRALSISRLDPIIQKAFALDKESKKALAAPGETERIPGQVPKRPDAVALLINSPGGSPAQSSLINEAIMRAKKASNIPVVAFVEDVAASGGYYLACAADDIVVNENSIVGSIGVIGGGFGAEEAIRKLGLTRRIMTSGDRKNGLDPFLPEDPATKAHMESIVGFLHDKFRSVVRRQRGPRLGAVFSLDADKLAEVRDAPAEAEDGAAVFGPLKSVELETGKVLLLAPRADGSEHKYMPLGWSDASTAPPMTKVDDLFHGDVFPGDVAVHLGLADGLGSLRPEMQRRMLDASIVASADDVVFEEVKGRQSILGRFFSHGFGSEASSAAAVGEAFGAAITRGAISGAAEAEAVSFRA